MKKDQIKKALEENNIFPDKLTQHKDGTFTFKRSFFYTHGISADIIAEKIKKALPGVVILEAFDDWKEWPKTSYFVVRFTLGECQNS